MNSFMLLKVNPLLGVKQYGKKHIAIYCYTADQYILQYAVYTKISHIWPLVVTFTLTYMQKKW